MKKRYFYFFDLNEILIDRYPAKIADYLHQNFDGSKFIFIYAEKYTDGIPKKIPQGSKFIFLPDLSLKKLEKIIRKYPPVSLTTIAQRIPDMLMLSYFNSLGIPTFIVQHGLWSDKLERVPIPLLLINKFSKFLKYINYTNKLTRLNNIPFVGAISELYKFLIKEEIYIPNTKYLNQEKLRANKAFVFDESWDNYYIEKYGYNKNDLIYIGNPDFLILKKNISVSKEDAVCYICQTLIEDGRYLRAEFNDFLDILKNQVAPHKKLYIKLHPRSIVDNYKLLKNVKNIVFINDFPICTHYIGHYSAVLAIARQTTDNVLIWSLKNHHMPSYFKKFASCITDDKYELTNFVKNKRCSQKVTPKFNKMSIKDLESFDPISVIGKNLINFSINE